MDANQNYRRREYLNAMLRDLEEFREKVTLQEVVPQQELITMFRKLEVLKEEIADLRMKYMKEAQDASGR
jgi:hypothetical protein